MNEHEANRREALEAARRKVGEMKSKRQQRIEVLKALAWRIDRVYWGGLEQGKRGVKVTVYFDRARCVLPTLNEAEYWLSFWAGNPRGMNFVYETYNKYPQ
jgi:hypothetical protein